MCITVQHLPQDSVKTHTHNVKINKKTGHATALHVLFVQ